MTPRARQRIWAASAIAAMLMTGLYALAMIVLPPSGRPDVAALAILIGWNLSLLGIHVWRKNGSMEKNEKGQTLVEYGLLLALIAIVVIVALILIGPIISQIFANTANVLNQTP